MCSGSDYFCRSKSFNGFNPSKAYFFMVSYSHNSVLFLSFRRRTNKQSSPICTKVLSSERAAVNTHINKDYAQTQYLYRHNGIPDRRGLPCEVRMDAFDWRFVLHDS